MHLTANLHYFLWFKEWFYNCRRIQMLLWIVKEFISSTSDEPKNVWREMGLSFEVKNKCKMYGIKEGKKVESTRAGNNVMMLSRHHFPLGWVHTTRSMNIFPIWLPPWTLASCWQKKSSVPLGTGDPCCSFSKFRFDVDFLIRLYKHSYHTWILGFIEVNSKFTNGGNKHEKEKKKLVLPFTVYTFPHLLNYNTTFIA